MTQINTPTNLKRRYVSHIKNSQKVQMLIKRIIIMQYDYVSSVQCTRSQNH